MVVSESSALHKVVASAAQGGCFVITRRGLRAPDGSSCHSSRTTPLLGTPFAERQLCCCP
eukprot:scaffold388_cov244-Pinguiococcus_pyrenoidosus.AAC.44